MLYGITRIRRTWTQAQHRWIHSNWIYNFFSFGTLYLVFQSKRFLNAYVSTYIFILYCIITQNMSSGVQNYEINKLLIISVLMFYCGCAYLLLFDGVFSVSNKILNISSNYLFHQVWGLTRLACLTYPE